MRATAALQGLGGTSSFLLAAPRASSSRVSAGRSMQCSTDGTLYDFPISNNGGRVRVVIYDKGLQDRIK